MRVPVKVIHSLLEDRRRWNDDPELEIERTMP
jgi:hypothetical protein